MSASRKRSAAVADDFRQRGYGPGMPAGTRRQAVWKEMHGLGASMADIARLFEVSAETVRHSLAGRFAMYVSQEEHDLIMQFRGCCRIDEDPWG